MIYRHGFGSKFIYICIRVIAVKQDLILDYFAFNTTYDGKVDSSYFWLNINDDLWVKEHIYRFEVIAK